MRRRPTQSVQKAGTGFTGLGELHVNGASGLFLDRRLSSLLAHDKCGRRYVCNTHPSTSDFCWATGKHHIHAEEDVGCGLHGGRERGKRRQAGPRQAFSEIRSDGR